MDDLFTKRKFLKLPYVQQLKKCAEILRRAYTLKSEEALEQYNRLMSFLQMSPLEDFNLKAISDAYHKALISSQQELKEHNLLPLIRTGDRDFSEPLYSIDIYLDKIRSAHNVGSIVRTIEAFSLGELYLSKETPKIMSKKVQDTAMGADKHIIYHENIDLSALKRPIIALETSKTAISIYDFTFPESFTLVCGNEEYGCSDETLRIADYLVEIPLRGRKNSLNVANAFAIAAGEISRQKSRN